MLRAAFQPVNQWWCAMERVRSFLAVPLPSDVEQAVAATLREMKRELSPVRWVEPENIHITVKFYGGVEVSMLRPLRDAIAGVASFNHPFCIEIIGAGAFPSAGRARVLWLGIDDPDGGLARIAAEVEDASERLSFPREERPFSPHLTIGRAPRGGAVSGAAETLPRYAGRSFGRVEVRELVLFRSDLMPGGPVYSSQARFELGSGSSAQ